MAEKTTFIKLDRNMTTWRWFKTENMFIVFVYLIMSANIKDNPFGDVIVHRGELVTSYESIAFDCGLTVNRVRTIIKRLKRTGEVTARIYPKFQVISILKYDYYQGNAQGNAQASHTQGTGNAQSSHNNQRIKECNNGRMKENIIPPPTAPPFGGGGAEEEDPKAGIPAPLRSRFETYEDYKRWCSQ